MELSCRASFPQLPRELPSLPEARSPRPEPRTTVSLYHDLVFKNVSDQELTQVPITRHDFHGE